MDGRKVATLVFEEDSEVGDHFKLINDRLELFNDDVQCISNEDGTYDVIRTDN